MPTRSVLIDAKDGKTLATEDFWRGPHEIERDERVLMVVDPSSAHSTFRAVTGASSGTVTLVTPKDSGSIIVSDIVLSGDRVNGGQVAIRFTDGTNTINIFVADVTDAPVTLAIPFEGRVQGWKDARIDVVVTGNVTYSVMATFMKVPDGLPFSEWDELR